jgi:hypothetical protein
MQLWQEIKDKYTDQWVALNIWEENEAGDVLRGDVIHCDKERKAFYSYVSKNFQDRNLAIRFTGKIRGPFFISK